MHILLRRQAYLSIKEVGTRTTQILELIHSDLCRLMENKSLGRYFITLIDDFSRKVVYFMEDKTNVLSKFKELKALVENQLNKTIKAIWTDHGKNILIMFLKII